MSKEWLYVTELEVFNCTLNSNLRQLEQNPSPPISTDMTEASYYYFI